MARIFQSLVYDCFAEAVEDTLTPDVLPVPSASGYADGGIDWRRCEGVERALKEAFDPKRIIESASVQALIMV